MIAAASTSGPLSRALRDLERQRRREEATRRAEKEAARRRREEQAFTRPTATLGDLIVVCSAVTGRSVEEITARFRPKSIVRARQIVMWLASRRLGMSLPRIGRRLVRDHTTVLHGVRVIDRIAAARGVTAETPIREAIAILAGEAQDHDRQPGPVDNFLARRTP